MNRELTIDESEERERNLSKVREKERMGLTQVRFAIFDSFMRAQQVWHGHRRPLQAGS